MGLRRAPLILPVLLLRVKAGAMVDQMESQAAEAATGAAMESQEVKTREAEAQQPVTPLAVEAQVAQLRLLQSEQRLVEMEECRWHRCLVEMEERWLRRCCRRR